MESAARADCFAGPRHRPVIGDEALDGDGRLFHVLTSGVCADCRSDAACTWRMRRLANRQVRRWNNQV